MGILITEKDAGRKVNLANGKIARLGVDKLGMFFQGLETPLCYVMRDGISYRNNDENVISFADEPATLSRQDIAVALGASLAGFHWFARSESWPKSVKPVSGGHGGRNNEFRYKASDLDKIKAAYAKRPKQGVHHKKAVKPVSVPRGTVKLDTPMPSNVVSSTLGVSQHSVTRQGIAIELIQQGYSEAGVWLLTGKK